jgi:hypothetical protein
MSTIYTNAIITQPRHRLVLVEEQWDQVRLNPMPLGLIPLVQSIQVINQMEEIRGLFFHKVL